MTSREKAEKLHEIADTLEEWGKYNEKVTNSAEWGTPEAKQIIRKAMTLLVDNLALINECKNKYGCFSPLQQCFTAIEQAASWPKTKDLGDCRSWSRDFTVCHLWGGDKRSLADECVRYANKVDKETEQENKDTKENQKGVLEPKPPELFQNILWILRYGKKWWWLLLLAALVLLLLHIMPKLNLEYQNIHPEAKTSGSSSPAINTSGPNSPVIVNYDSPTSKTERSIELIPSISQQDLDKKLVEIRNSEKVRDLTPLETGRNISETPTGTYFFVSSFFMAFPDGNIKSMLKNCRVNSYKKDIDYFEIHKRSENQIILLGYVSDETGALLSNEANRERREIVLFPSLQKNFQNLVMIPINRISKSNYREINSPETGDIEVLDMLIE
jgi:hypothetical protein